MNKQRHIGTFDYARDHRSIDYELSEANQQPTPTRLNDVNERSPAQAIKLNNLLQTSNNLINENNYDYITNIVQTINNNNNINGNESIGRQDSAAADILGVPVTFNESICLF
jgi:hypothetical protein